MSEMDNKSRGHVCPVCGEYNFPTWFSYEVCPVCGIEDGFCPADMEEVDEVQAPNIVSISEARWVWQKFHTDVNEYGNEHKEKIMDKLTGLEDQKR